MLAFAWRAWRKITWILRICSLQVLTWTLPNLKQDIGYCQFDTLKSVQERWALVGRPEGKRPLERPRHRWEYNIKIIFRKWCGEAQTGLIWPMIGTCGRHSWTRSWTFRYQKVWGISWLAEDLLASQEVHCSIELVRNLHNEIHLYTSYFLCLFGHTLRILC